MKKSRQHKLLSIILPTYKQERTILRNLNQLEKNLSKLSIPFEIIVVVDGIHKDKTFSIVKQLRRKRLFVYGYDTNLGKGHAVQYGVLKAKGDIIGFIDAGTDLDSKGIGTLIKYMQDLRADIVIGSKLHADSKVNYPLLRKLMSWGYRTYTHLLFGFGVKDTQVGLKLFKRTVARDVFTRILVKRFAFDVEILAVAHALGYKKIYEAPIKLTYDWNSSILSRNFWIVIFWMLWDTSAVFYRLRILHYYDRKKQVTHKKLVQS